MPTTTLQLDCRGSSVFPDPTSVVLSDATGSYGVRRVDTGATVVADGTAMTKVATGLYQYSFTSTAGLTYEAWYEVKVDSSTYYVPASVTATAGATGTRNAAYWTRTTLGQHLMVEIPSCGRGPNGSAPPRLAEIVNQALADVERRRKWRWRIGNGTLTTTAGTETVRLSNLYADFGKLLSETLTETSGNGTVQVTADVDVFRAEQYRRGTGGGEPVLAILEPDTSLSEFGWQLRFVPTPSAARTYRFDYQRTMAAIDTTTVPTWPDFMHWLWYLSAKWQAIYAFDGTKGNWKEARDLFIAELATCVSENDNPEESQLIRIGDSNGDLAAFASSGLALGYGDGLIGGNT